MNEAILDFKDWLGGIDLKNYDDVHSLYMSIQQIDAYGGFSTTVRDTKNGEQFCIKCDWCEQPLILQSEKARQYMLKHIEQNHCGDMDMNSWYAYHKAMEKED